MEKQFFISREKIQQLIPDIGYCIATDKIMVEGAKVGFMYREYPDNKGDSGWRFLAGDETQRYLDDSQNSGLYKVNTVANYDGAIIPYLYLPYNTELIRIDNSDEFKILN